MVAAAPRRSPDFVFVSVAIDAMEIGIDIRVVPDLLQGLTGLWMGFGRHWGMPDVTCAACSP